MLKRSVSLALLTILLTLSLADAIMFPAGIAGRVKINGIYQNGIEVTIKNLDTGETKTVTTTKADNGENGWYVVAISAQDGNRIQIICTYNGNTFTNYTTVDLSRTTQYLNLSITTESGGGENPSETPSAPSPSSPPPSPPPPPPPLKANFTYYPENPEAGEEVTFTDTSEGVISSRTWTIDGNTFTTKTVNYTFTLPGYYTVSLVVMDAYGNIDICQKAIFIKSSEQSSGTNESNISQEPQKTNITLFILIKDKNNQTIPNAKVEIYQNNTVVQVVYTNETGVAQATLPPGSYKIKAYYGTQTETKRMEFVNDGRVVFLFNPEEMSKPAETFNWIYIVIPIAVIAVALVVFLRWRQKRWY